MVVQLFLKHKQFAWENIFADVVVFVTLLLVALSKLPGNYV